LSKTASYKITQIAVISSLYIVLTHFSNIFGLAFSGLQFRISEALTILPVFTSSAVPGITIGCLISNLSSPYGIIDIILGTFSSLISARITRKLKNIKYKNLPILAPLPPVVISALSVSFLISFTVQEKFNFSIFTFLFLNIFISEFITCYVLGLLLYIFIEKNIYLKKYFN